MSRRDARPGAKLQDVTVGDVLFLSPRVGRTAAAAAMVTALAVSIVSGCGGESDAPAATETPVTSTTKIAGAGVLGNQRRPDESCAPEPAAPDPGFEERTVRHAAGATALRGEPERIVVLSGDQLDALCALGLQRRIVAAALPDDSDSQPGYLGTTIHDLPGVGTHSTPDFDAVKAANPDLILGSEALTPESYRALTDIAPTVFTGAPGPEWRDVLRTVGAATGRADAANGLVDGFERDADRTGTENDATHYQASVIQLTEDTMRVFGRADFPGSVLAAAGVDRPAAQRFTDNPFLEFGITELGGADFSPAEGDIVYVSFSGPAAKDRAAAVLDSAAWRKLSAARDNRVFIVNNEIWQTGEGLVAARGVLDDLKTLNGPVN